MAQFRDISGLHATALISSARIKFVFFFIDYNLIYAPHLSK
jgi:hypothetical protein